MPAGRPSKLDDTARVTRDGRKVSVYEAIVEAMRIGDYIESASMAAGVNKHTVYGWLRTGADLTARQHRATDRGLKVPKGTAHERRCQEFSTAVGQATEEWHLATIGTLEQMARGGRTVTTVTERVNAEGVIVDRSTRTETLQPSIQALEWRLRRRFPQRYAERVEVTGAEGGPLEISIEDRAASLAGQLRAYLDGHDDAPDGHAGADETAGAQIPPTKANGAETATQGA